MNSPRCSISRRTLLSAGLAGSGSIVLSGSFPNNRSAAAKEQTGSGRPNLSTLKSQFGFRGGGLDSSDPGFEQMAFGGLWNKLQPKRHPQIIARARDEQDVVAAVKFARAKKLKVTVRGGGHEWCSPSLRDNGLLIDLSNLNRVLSIDAGARRAVVQPVVSNRRVQTALNSHGMGPGVASVEAIEIVNAKGKVITASATENPDYFWAARGCGPGFFGVALRYHLKLYPLPRAIMSSVYYYPYEHLVQSAEWLGQLARQLPSSIELSLFVIQAPPDLVDKTNAGNRRVALVSAVMFADFGRHGQINTDRARQLSVTQPMPVAIRGQADQLYETL